MVWLFLWFVDWLLAFVSGLFMLDVVDLICGLLIVCLPLLCLLVGFCLVAPVLLVAVWMLVG